MTFGVWSQTATIMKYCGICCVVSRWMLYIISSCHITPSFMLPSAFNNGSS